LECTKRTDMACVKAGIASIDNMRKMCCTIMLAWKKVFDLELNRYTNASM